MHACTDRSIKLFFFFFEEWVQFEFVLHRFFLFLMCSFFICVMAIASLCCSMGYLIFARFARNFRVSHRKTWNCGTKLFLCGMMSMHTTTTKKIESQMQTHCLRQWILQQIINSDVCRRLFLIGPILVG